MIIFLKKGSPLSRFFEEMPRRDELEEMATLKKTITGLPVNIWVDETKAYTLGGHAKRIKFQGDYGNNTNRSNLFTMILSKDDPQIPAKQLPKLKLPAKDIESIKTFVKNNADILDKLADERIDIATFLKQMKT
jgi:hypothetical protein